MTSYTMTGYGILDVAFKRQLHGRIDLKGKPNWHSQLLQH